MVVNSQQAPASGELRIWFITILGVLSLTAPLYRLFTYTSAGYNVGGGYSYRYFTKLILYMMGIGLYASISVLLRRRPSKILVYLEKHLKVSETWWITLYGIGSLILIEYLLFHQFNAFLGTDRSDRVWSSTLILGGFCQLGIFFTLLSYKHIAQTGPFLSFTSIVGFFIIAETFLRFVGIGYVLPVDIYAYKKRTPNAEWIYLGQLFRKKEFKTKVKFNSLGFHDKEYTFEKPSETFRILILGDSYVEALQVPLRYSFHKQLEEKLNSAFPDKRFQVIALGQSGNGQVKEYEVLAQLGYKFRPDLVIVEFLASNDVVDNSPELTSKRDVLKWYYELWNNPLTKSLMDKGLANITPLIVYNIRKLIHNRLKQEVNIESFVYQEKVYDPIWESAWETTLSSFLKMHQLCQLNSCQLIIASFTSPAEISAYRGDTQKFLKEVEKSEPGYGKIRWDFKRPGRIVKEFSEKHRISYVDLNPYLANYEQETGQRTHYPSDGHWNQNGHAVAAEVIFNYLKDTCLIKAEGCSRH